MGWGKGTSLLTACVLKHLKTDPIAFFKRKSKKKSKNAGNNEYFPYNTCKNYSKVRKNLEISIHALRW